jgi:hypothetical protein
MGMGKIPGIEMLKEELDGLDCEIDCKQSASICLNPVIYQVEPQLQNIIMVVAMLARLDNTNLPEIVYTK